MAIDSRSSVPTLQNTTLESREAALAYPTGAIEMMWCPQCTFVWNDRFDPSAISYDDNYNNDVSTSDYYLAHLNSMADRVLAACPTDGPITYVEIGCGEGDFLRLVMERSHGRCVQAIGFDPSFTGEDHLPPNAVVHKTFFGPEELSLVPAETNVVCSRHTIEHVPDPHNFAKSLAFLMTTEHRRLVVETPDVNWILENTAFQDFFYEHCSIYTPKSITHLLESNDLICVVTPVYDNQYMWIEAKLARPTNGGDSLLLPSQTQSSDAALPENYRSERSNLMRSWEETLRSRAAHGPIAIWGAASKGVTFSLLLREQLGVPIDCAIDLNQAKQGRFLPTTALPVVSPETAKAMGVETVIIMNPNYRSEIQTLCKSLHWNPWTKTLND